MQWMVTSHQHQKYWDSSCYQEGRQLLQAFSYEVICMIAVV